MRNRVMQVLLAAAALVLMGLLAGAFSQGTQAAGAPGKAESPPKPIILHFKNIPAESFLQTLKQLGGNSSLGDALRQVPIALNEPANSVVIIGPPELGEFFAAIAKGLDQPNEFRDAMMQQQRQQMEAQLKFEEARHKLGLPPPPQGPMPGGCMCPNCPMNRQGPPQQMQQRMQQMQQQMQMRQQMQPGAPMGPPLGMRPQDRPMMGAPNAREQMQPGANVRPGMNARPEAPGRGPGPQILNMLPEGTVMGTMVIRQLWSLVSEPARQALGINEEQAGRIQKVLSGASQEMVETAKRMEDAVNSVPAEKRLEAAREWWQKNTPERAKRAERVRKEVFEALKPEQRERAEKWLNEHPLGQEKPRGSEGFRGSDGPAGQVPAMPAAGEQPARFILVQNEGGPPQGMGGMAGMMNLFSPEERERMQMIMQRAQDLRYLDDPDVRAELKINTDQEKKFQDLKDRAQALFQTIGSDVQAKIRDRMPTPDMTDEQRMAAIEDIKMVVADTVRGALNEVEGMVGEANGMLTEEQRTQLKVLAPQLTQSDQLTNGLSYLASTKAREEFAFTYDQSEKIKMILRDIVTDLKKARDDIAGPDKVPTPEELRSEKYAPFRAKQTEMLKRTFDRILTILTTEQREKVQKWYDTRMTRGQRGMGRGGVGGRPGGAPEGAKPNAAPEGAKPNPAPAGAPAGQ